MALVHEPRDMAVLGFPKHYARLSKTGQLIK